MSNDALQLLLDLEADSAESWGALKRVAERHNIGPLLTVCNEQFERIRLAQVKAVCAAFSRVVALEGPDWVWLGYDSVTHEVDQDYNHHSYGIGKAHMVMSGLGRGGTLADGRTFAFCGALVYPFDTTPFREHDVPCGSCVSMLQDESDRQLKSYRGDEPFVAELRRNLVTLWLLTTEAKP